MQYIYVYIYIYMLHVVVLLQTEIFDKIPKRIFKTRRKPEIKSNTSLATEKSICSVPSTSLLQLLIAYSKSIVMDTTSKHFTS